MVIDEIDALVQARSGDIEAWFTEQERGHQPPYYASFDIRHAGYKVAVVDTNLFPAGFNNLCNYSWRIGAEQSRDYFSRYYPQAKRVLIIPESNTRNPGYTANIARLQAMLAQGGIEAAVGTLIDSVPAAGAELEGLDGLKVRLMPFTVHDGVPEVGGEPPAIEKLRVPVVPRRVLGWHKRKKSRHFAHLGFYTSTFAEAFGIDPWLLHAETEALSDVSFDAPDERLRGAVERMLARTREAFAKRGIHEEPYVFVKHDAGTYGMGVLPIHSVHELETLNRDARKKMQKGKGGVEITGVIVQEGLPTRDRVKDAVGEPVVYAVNNHIIGGFFRIHSGSDDRTNLNKPGQIFAKLCSTPTKEQSRDQACYHDSRLFRVYGVMARLAGLAVVAEREELERLS